MKMRMLGVAALLAPTVLLAGPADKVDPVAAGYPTWLGVTPGNFAVGRELCASDLRHKLTVVVEVEANEKLAEQLVKAYAILGRAVSGASLGMGGNWEDAELPRNCIALVSVRGMSPKAAAGIAGLLLNKDKLKKDKTAASELSRLSGTGCSFYRDVTFAGAPDTTGKRPYVYVFGPTGAEPLAHGPLETVAKDANAAIDKARKEINGWDPKWRPFFGNIGTPKFNTSLAKALEKGKAAKKMPLDPVAKGLLADVKSSDAGKAKEAQILFDAINQTKSDLVLRIGAEASACPHRAYYDIQQLLKYWPSESKRVDAALKRIDASPSAKSMGEIFAKLMEWGDPSYVCKNQAEVKANVIKLQKMKKTLAPIKESPNITAQNGALLLDMRVDDLISQMPSKVAAK